MKRMNNGAAALSWGGGFQPPMRDYGDENQAVAAMAENGVRKPPLHGNYLPFISVLQTIGIILVVLGHSFHEYPDGDYGRTLLIYRMLYSFHMPLFLFVSGFLMLFTTRMPGRNSAGIGSFTLKKIRRLLVPFAVLTLVTFVPRALLSQFADDPVSLSAESFLKAFFLTDGLVLPFMWFIQTSFTLLIFCHIYITLLEKSGAKKIIIVATLTAIFLLTRYIEPTFGNLFSLGETLRLGIYFAAGIVYCQLMPSVDRLIRWNSVWTVVIAGAIWAGLFFLTAGTSWDLLCGLAGIAMCISAAHIIADRDIRFLDHLSGANYLIFLLSWYCNVFAQQFLHRLTDFPWWIYTILSLISGIYIPWLGYRWLQSHPDSRWVKLCAFLLGQSFRSR